MNILKAFLFFSLIIGNTLACELPFQITTKDTPSFDTCKELILHVMKEQKCSTQEIEAVESSVIVANSPSKYGVSFCSLTTKRGVYSAMEDFMSEPPVSTVYFSIWD